MKMFKSQLPELQLRYKTTEFNNVKVSSSRDAFLVLQPLYDPDLIEYLETSIVLFVNRANNTIGWLKISHGGQSGTVIDGKILFATALQCGAAGVIISHNHPSGNLKPSESDLKLTRKLVEVGKYIDLTVLDHLIVNKGNYFSFADEGLIY